MSKYRGRFPSTGGCLVEDKGHEKNSLHKGIHEFVYSSSTRVVLYALPFSSCRAKCSTLFAGESSCAMPRRINPSQSMPTGSEYRHSDVGRW
jgi:hypothetical protein